MARWIRRFGTKRNGFRYRRDDGRPVSAEDRARIAALRIPPAWRDVHIAASAAAPVQAWGYDVAGRKQYRYHVRSVERAERRKYHRVRRLGLDLPRIRRMIHRDFASAGLSRERVAAGVVRLISEKFFRVGCERYARENGSFGIATLRKKHARVRAGTIEFTYPGKRRIRQRQIVAEPTLARFVSQLSRTPGTRLFRYRSRDGWGDLTARDINDYLKKGIGLGYTAKDFRTWGGTRCAATVLAELGPADSPTEAKRNAALAVRLVASELGNTPAICRKSYVHPVIVSEYVSRGETIRIPPSRRRSRNGGHTPEEIALLEFLSEHFPDRRRRARPAETARG